MRSVSCLLVSLVLVSIAAVGACGGSTAGDGSCPTVPLHCQQGSCIDTPPPSCENGAWVCHDGPASCYVDASPADAASRDGATKDGASPLDASADAGCPLVPIHCHQGSCIDDPPPVCDHGTWVCPLGPPQCYDGGVPTFACGPSLMCTSSQYCEEASGGPPPPPDSGSGASYSCNPLPASCGATPSCACIPNMGGCWCNDSGGQITVSCAFP